jgi:anti-anti-sigma factor
MSNSFLPATPLAQLQISTDYPSPTTARVAVVGELDLATAPVLRERLLAVLHDQTPVVLDVDLGGVSFLDCVAVGVLVGVRNAAVRAGGRMRVTHLQPIVHRILDVTGLLSVFTAAVDQPEPYPQGPNTVSHPTVMIRPPSRAAAA